MKPIEDFLNYCEESQEQLGKDDALINVDSSFMFDYLKVIVKQAILKLLSVEIIYEGFITETNTKIENFKRFGMVDTVEDYNGQKRTAEKELLLSQDFKAHLKTTLADHEKNSGDIRKLDWGVAQGRMSSYARGFQKGVTDKQTTGQ